MKLPLKKYRKLFVDFTINIITPLLIFFSIVRLNQASYWFVPIIGGLIITGIGLGFPILFSKVKNLDNPDPAELCTSTFPNALNFPFPIIFALSPNALGAASIFLATTVIMRNTVGLYISGVKMDRANIIEIIKFPPIIGIIAGFVYKLIIHQDTISHNTPVDWLFQIGIIMTLMTVGFGLKRPNLNYKIPILRVSLSRFVVSGIFAFLLIFTLPINRDMSIALFVQMIAPPAVYNGLYAERFKLDTELTSQIIIAVTMIALIILPFELLLLQTIF